MKSEIRVAAATAVESLLTAIPNLIPVRVGKKDCYAIDTGVMDENGNPVYAVLEATVKNTEATKTSPAFDLAAAVAARQENNNKPKKEAKPIEPDPEKEARAAKREELMNALLAWCAENLSDTGMSTSDIWGAVPALRETGTSIMQTGTFLKALAADYPDIIKREIVDHKTMYFRA